MLILTALAGTVGYAVAGTPAGTCWGAAIGAAALALLLTKKGEDV